MSASGRRAAQLGRGSAVRDELGVDAAFADASRDQLRVLTAEVDDEDGPLLGRRLRRSWTTAASAISP